MLWLLLACRSCQPDPDLPGDSDASDTSPAPLSRPLPVLVMLDGTPVPDTPVLQGGNPERWTTDSEGRVTITLDLTVVGDIYVMANHPDARIGGDMVRDDDIELTIDLERFDTSDNPDYIFQDPGEGEWTGTTSAQCLHCHPTLHAGWTNSEHRTAASNPALHAVYQGTSTASEAVCNGRWTTIIEPGTGADAQACVTTIPVRGTASDTCADCHAPGIDGELGGRDLLDATGWAYDNGVHCDVCHKIESVDLTQPPGLGGAVRILRPTEPGSPAFGPYSPLTFGPYDDVPNPRMGSVYRALFHEALLCAGCHEAWEPVADTARWPTGLPIHTTYTEWTETNLSASPCQDCHMPPLPDTANSADLANDAEEGVGVATGWYRVPGVVRDHTFYGPRNTAAMLEMAAAVDVTVQAGAFTEVTVTTTNVGAGHRVPTGEPLRQVLYTVEATCAGSPLAAVSGAALPEWAGAIEVQDAAEDWSLWPKAEVGDRIAVVGFGEATSYAGFGPFGDGTFTETGLRTDQSLGVSTIVGVEDGLVTLDAPLVAGDRAYLLRGQALAGAPGWLFARIAVDATGSIAPHGLATDVVMDNRLAPNTSWTSEHTFLACDNPQVSVHLFHRDVAWNVAQTYGWDIVDSTMVLQ